MIDTVLGADVEVLEVERQAHAERIVEVDVGLVRWSLCLPASTGE